jgi:hypothetical protein
MTEQEASDILTSLGYMATAENINRVLEHSHEISGADTEEDILSGIE